MTLTILILFLTLKLTAPTTNVIPIIENEVINTSLTWKNIDAYIQKIGIKEPETVKAQIKHETGNLKSEFCVKSNNLCGMRYAPRRRTTAIGEWNHMAKYRSWQESLKDYLWWQNLYYKGGDYYNFLSSIHYATDPYYLFKLKRIKL